MNPEINQENNPRMTVDEARSALGLATRLSEQTFNPKIAPEGAKMPQGKEQKPEVEQESPKDDKILEEIQLLRQELETLLEEDKKEDAEE